MGLMDRDYYREKPKGSRESVIEKLKRNPLALIAVAVLLLFLISILI